jgi:hypothetical protein
MEAAKNSRTMGSLRTVAALTALLFIASQANAQTDEDAYRFVARAPATGSIQIGMGGASRAGLGDWTDAASNPAGLGWLAKHQIAGALANWNTKDEATYQLGNFSSYDETTSNYLALMNAGYVYKAPVIKGSLAVGIGYNQTNSFNREMRFDGENNANSITDYFMPLPTEFDIIQEAGPDGQVGTADDEYRPDFSRDLSFLAFETYAIDFDLGLFDNGDPVPFLPAVVTGTVSQTGQIFEDGHSGEFTIASAIEAMPNVMLGGGINIAYGHYNYSRIFDEADIQNANDGTGITTDFESLRLTDDLKTDLVGANLRLGMSAKVNPQLLLGLTMETPTYYAVNEDYSTTLNTYFDNGDAYEQSLSGLNEYEIETPWRMGGGLSYDIAGLTLSADAEYVDWSQLKLRAKNHRDDSIYDDVNLFIKREYDAVFNTRFGGSYDFGTVILRAGYANQPDPRPTADLNRDREYVSAGVGFKIQDTIQLNVGWMQERFDDQYQPYTEVAGAPVVSEKVTRDRVSVGVRVSL